MIEVPLYPVVTFKCSGACNYSKAFENAGKPNYIDYETYKGFYPKIKTAETH